MTDTSSIDSLIQGRVDPYIYAFETNTVPNFLKVGDTYRPVSVRLDEWRKVYKDLKKQYEHIAKVDDRTYFRDYSVHDFLMRNGFRRIEKGDISEKIYLSNEFFLNAKKENVEQAISDIQHSFEKKDNRYAFYNAEENLPLGDFDFKRDADWKPRENQKQVIESFSSAVKKGRTNLLLFAVMRFGKSFTSLCCAKAMGAKLVVVVCGKTAVRSEWKENVQRPKMLEGFSFADSESMKRNPTIVSDTLSQGQAVVVFLTMQDLLGADIKTRHADLFTLNEQGKLDLLIIDETHFGARAEEFGKVLGVNNANSGKAISKQEKKGYDDSVDDLETQIKIFKPRVKLHLSGTPYRILLDNEFTKDDIVGTVQYSDIIDAKEKWDSENIEKDEWENPYYGFPPMIRFAFNLNESAKAKLLDLKNNGYAYDLHELLSPLSTAKDNAEHNKFKYKDEVLDLLRAIDGNKDDKNIFSFLNYDKIKKGSMCRHIVMVLPYCASCDAMEQLLKTEKFNNLNGYEIINIAGFDSPKEFRIGKHLQIDVEELRLIRDKINPSILSYLEDKIQNINQLGSEITAENIGVALRKMSRLSVSEVVTPASTAKELVDNLPREITAKSKFLDIASKTGEFATAILKKYGDEAKNAIYSIPTSPVTYECTRKIYKLLGLPPEHIFSTFTSYDLIDKNKNEALLEELKNMNFDVIVGNPPYHKENSENGRKPPIYDQFMDFSHAMTPVSVLITPARFLFGAGQTPDSWNERILNDSHFKVAKYEPDAQKVFPNAIEDIKGGVLISLYNNNFDYGAIGVFSAYKELNTILQKLMQKNDFNSIENIVSSQGVFKFTKDCLAKYPEIERIAGKGTKEKIVSRIVELLPNLFFETANDDNCISLLAKGKTSRIKRFIERDYIQQNDYIATFNVLVPESNGKGAFDEFSSPVISEPSEGFSDTFIAIGAFDNRKEAENLLKYIKTKFARAMLGIKKATQHNPKSTWTYVPLQDFTASSDIDWSKSIPEIDAQLYKKYRLSPEEVEFIEKNVKTM